MPPRTIFSSSPQVLRRWSTNPWATFAFISAFWSHLAIGEKKESIGAVVALVVGLAVSVLQAVTQIQEQTLVFVPKILAMVATTVLLCNDVLDMRDSYGAQTAGGVGLAVAFGLYLLRRHMLLQLAMLGTLMLTIMPGYERLGFQTQQVWSGTTLLVIGATWFVLGWRKVLEPGRGARIVGAHTDSPGLRIKPRPDGGSFGWKPLAVEVYGGALLNSWLDRDLGVAGRVVLTDGKVIDSIIHGLATPLGTMPSALGALAMIPVHALLHIAVPSVSGHGVLTMPIMAPSARTPASPRKRFIESSQS